MILLQANMLFGATLLTFFGIFLLFGIPILTGISMKLIWRISGKIDYIKQNTPYYKDPFTFSLSLIYSIIILSVFYYKLTLLIDVAF